MTIVDCDKLGQKLPNTWMGTPQRPRDANQLAMEVVDLATGEVDETPSNARERASKAVKVGGRASADSLSSKRRSEIAKKAAEARWRQ